jgi:hypothetical protein
MAMGHANPQAFLKTYYLLLYKSKYERSPTQQWVMQIFSISEYLCSLIEQSKCEISEMAMGHANPQYF